MKAALRYVRRSARKKGVAVSAIRVEVRIARGMSHAIDEAKWKVINLEKFSPISPPGI